MHHRALLHGRQLRALSTKAPIPSLQTTKACDRITFPARGRLAVQAAAPALDTVDTAVELADIAEVEAVVAVPEQAPAGTALPVGTVVDTAVAADTAAVAVDIAAVAVDIAAVAADTAAVVDTVAGGGKAAGPAVAGAVPRVLAAVVP